MPDSSCPYQPPYPYDPSFKFDESAHGEAYWAELERAHLAKYGPPRRRQEPTLADLPHSKVCSGCGVVYDIDDFDSVCARCHQTGNHPNPAFPMYTENQRYFD